MTATVELRAARPGDRPALSTIQQAALSDPNGDILQLATDGPLTSLVAVADDEPVGYVIAVAGDDGAYLPELAVTPDRQGDGIGSTLLAAVCERLAGDGLDTVRLTARASDHRVRSFYENRGFEQVDREAAYYADGDDGVVYERRLA